MGADTEERGLEVLEDPAADEAYTYLQREKQLTPEQLATLSGIPLSEAQAGLRLLGEAGLATEEGDGESFALAESGAATPSLPVPTPAAEAGSVAEEQPETPAAAPTAVDDSATRLDPEVVLALARGEAVKLRVEAWVENQQGDLKVLRVLGVKEARMPGEGPVT